MLVIPGRICPREKLSLSVRFPLARTKFVKEIPLTFPLVLRPVVIKLNFGINSGFSVSTPGFHLILSRLGLENLIPFLEGVCISIKV